MFFSMLFTIFSCNMYIGKSLSEALIFASTNPQYDNRLFIELQVQYMKILSSEHGENMLCIEIGFFILFRMSKPISVHRMFSPCSANIRASDKDLPIYILQLKIVNSMLKNMNHSSY